MMTIVSCPQCRQKLQVKDEVLGSTIQCPACKHPFAAAATDGPAPAPPPQQAQPAEGGPRPPPLPEPAGEEEEYERPLEEGEASETSGRKACKPIPVQREKRYAGYYDELMKFQRRRQVPHRGVLILVLGIVGVTSCLICAIFAWYMGTNDLQEMYRHRMDKRGENLTKIGRLLGIIGIWINVVSIVLGCGGCTIMLFLGLLRQ
jgi:hypothetical protein